MKLPFALKFLPIVVFSLLSACGGGGSSSPAPSPTTEPTTVPTAVPTVAPTLVPDPGDTGEPMINTQLEDAGFWVGDNNGEEVGNGVLSSVEHSEFDEAMRISVSNPSGEFWNGQLSFPSIANVEAGDVLLAHFYMRSIQNSYESGNSFVTAFVEEHDNYDKYLNREVSAAGDWVEYHLPFEVSEAQSSGNLSLKFGFGAGDRPQVFEIAGVELLNFGAIDIATLPATQPSYGGREENAAWRAAAAQRIEQHRKGDFQIQVLDAGGEPVSGASVSVEFQKHAYHFGSVTVGHILLDSPTDAVSDADSSIYREKVLELFNQSGPENDLKWAPWIGEWGDNFEKTQTLNALQWLRDNGLYTRGHVMVWPSKRNLPEFIQDDLPEGDPASANPEVLQTVLDHIDDIGSATADYVDEWDVLNEPYDNHYLMDAFGDGIMVDWFNQARTNLPGHGLYLNDYSILSAGGRNYAHQDHFENTLQYLLDNNAPVTGMGMQSHFGESPTDIEVVYSILERFHAAFPELDIRSTEFDINTTNEALQADYTRDFLTIFFSHPATVGVQLWGFWEGAHWSSNAAMYDRNWREKPNAVAWKEQIYSQWWNDFSLVTDASGVVSERGFYGDYKATISLNGDTREFDFRVLPNTASEFVFSYQ